MSFFRNLRSSISRGKSSSGDTKTVKASSVSSSRPSSVASNAASFATDRRRDSMGSHTDSLFNRSDTFILGSDDNHHNSNYQQQRQQMKHLKQEKEQGHGQGHGQGEEDKNISNQDKKSKKSKSKVLSKFSTFTKRKKNPTTSISSLLGTDGSTYEHHPNDNATNTYYKWNSDGTSSTNLDYDAQMDPFNFLYEQHSNLKTLKNGIENTDERKNSSGGGGGSGDGGGGHFDSSTYRKGKTTSHLKDQLEQLKTQQQLQQQHQKENNIRNRDDLAEEEDVEETESDTNKYKTVTLNSFRKSFRDKFLQQQKDAALYNPSWFIEVDSSTKSADDHSSQHDSKENRREYLVFENENYRPSSRSPVRCERSISDGRQSRSATRSPVKRHETFRVDRNNGHNALQSHGNESIHVEIKNSVLPNDSGRMVPIGVAKPMQTSGLYRATSASTSSASTAANYTPTISTTRFKIATPTKTPTTTPTAANQQQSRAGRYQTLVQISGDNQGSAATNMTASPSYNRQSRNRDRNHVMATHIQLGGPENMPATHKYKNNNNNNVPLRHSYVGSPVSQILLTNPTSVGLSSYELIRNSNTNIKPQRLKQTYFGGDLKLSTSNVKVPTSTTYNRLSNPMSTRLINYQIGPDSSQITSSGNKFRQHSNWQSQSQPQSQSHSPKRSSSTMITGAPTAGYGYPNRQPRQTVSTQRRSRSPIKLPWR